MLNGRPSVRQWLTCSPAGPQARAEWPLPKRTLALRGPAAHTVSAYKLLRWTACGKLRPGLCYLPRKCSLFDESGSARLLACRY